MGSRGFESAVWRLNHGGSAHLDCNVLAVVCTGLLAVELEVALPHDNITHASPEAVALANVQTGNGSTIVNPKHAYACMTMSCWGARAWAGHRPRDLDRTYTQYTQHQPGCGLGI